MKKEKRKVQILRSMSEGDIKALGGNLWMRRIAKRLIAVAVLCFGWMLVGAVILVGWIGIAISLLPALVLLLVWTLQMDKEGKKLWNWAKDESQPVNVDAYLMQYGGRSK